jgi:hypothetical protein
MNRFGALGCLAGLVLVARPVEGQRPANRASVYGEFGARFLGSARRAEGAASTSGTDYWEWLRVGLRGRTDGHGLLVYDLSIAPTWVQTRFRGTENANERNRAHLDLSARATLFPRGVLTATGSGSRNRATNRDSFGTERRRTTAEAGGEVAIRSPILPLEFRYRARGVSEEIFAATDKPFRWNTQSSLFRLTAENRKTLVRLERLATRVSTSTQPDALGIDRIRVLGHFAHRAFWGKGSRLESSLSYIRTGGQEPSRSIGWAERLHLQHTRSVSSSFHYGRSLSSIGDDETRAASAGWNFNVRAFKLVGIANELLWQSKDYRGGHASLFRIAPSARLAALFARGIRLDASGSAGYERIGSRIGDGGWIAVVDEAYVVDASRRISLENPSIDATSLTVQNSDATLVYQLGLDYETAAVGPLLDIIVLPTGRIAAGDTLLVSYRFRSGGAPGGNSLLVRYSAVLTLGPVRVYHRRWLRDTRGDGQALTTGFPYGQRDDLTVGATVATRTPLGALDAGVDLHRFEVESFLTSSYSARAGLRFGLWGGAWGAVRASVATGRSTAGPQGTVASSARIHWKPSRSLVFDGNLGVWQWSRPDRTSSYVVGGGLDAEYRVGLTRVELRYSRSVWQDQRRSARDQLTASVVRIF